MVVFGKHHSRSRVGHSHSGHVAAHLLSHMLATHWTRHCGVCRYVSWVAASPSELRAFLDWADELLLDPDGDPGGGSGGGTRQSNPSGKAEADGDDGVAAPRPVQPDSAGQGPPRKGGGSSGSGTAARPGGAGGEGVSGRRRRSGGGVVLEPGQQLLHPRGVKRGAAPQLLGPSGGGGIMAVAVANAKDTAEQVREWVRVAGTSQ
jgi:hypothetical protein